MCFNPRTHEGCDGLTRQKTDQAACFNPRTHEGCDRPPRAEIPEPISFNPRTHEGCDRNNLSLTTYLNSFNPRTHEGCDLESGTIAERQIKFQSTHPRGVRQIKVVTKTKEDSFNPRTHEGCDLQCYKAIRPHRSFNPRTHEGCDMVFPPCLVVILPFQSTHPRGVRPTFSNHNSETENVSIHAPTRGATVKAAVFKGAVRVSIHAPTRGATGFDWYANSVSFCFNPRTHEGCDKSALS